MIDLLLHCLLGMTSTAAFRFNSTTIQEPSALTYRVWVLNSKILSDNIDNRNFNSVSRYIIISQTPAAKVTNFSDTIFWDLSLQLCCQILRFVHEKADNLNAGLIFLGKKFSPMQSERILPLADPQSSYIPAQHQRKILRILKTVFIQMQIAPLIAELHYCMLKCRDIPFTSFCICPWDGLWKREISVNLSGEMIFLQETFGISVVTFLLRL